MGETKLERNARIEKGGLRAPIPFLEISSIRSRLFELRFQAGEAAAAESSSLEAELKARGPGGLIVDKQGDWY